MQLRLLGGFDAQVSGQSGAPLSIKKAQALLAYLALHPDQHQPRDKLAALLWGNTADDVARTNLRQTLAVLRKRLNHKKYPCVLSSGTALYLDPHQVEIDVIRFEQCCDRGTSAALEEAVTHYQGGFLEGFNLGEEAFEDWLMGERRRLHERQLQALNTLLTHYMDAEQYERAIDTAVKLLALDPLQEAVHRILMQCYCAVGRRRAVLRQYQSLRDILQRELGLKPEIETERLYRHLLSLPQKQDECADEYATPADQIEHRLAVILHAGVADYNRLRGEDKTNTHRILDESLSAITASVADHRGRTVNTAGASVLAEFPNPVEALRAALEMQAQLDEHNIGLAAAQCMYFRIGIALGNVTAAGDHLLGDGVDIASGLEAMARPGGLCVSAAVFEQVRDHLDLQFNDLGEHALSNITRPVRVYRVPLASEYQPLSPFRGLAAFDIEHAEFFHGRNDAIAAAKTRLGQQAAAGRAFLLIYGMSGVGKSSLIRTGLLPAFTQADAAPEAALWRYAILRPAEGVSPLAALVAALLAETALPALAATGTGAELEHDFQQNPDAAIQRLQKALAQLAKHTLSVAASGQPPKARLLLLVDQLEELFTAGQIDTAAREQFISALTLLAGSGWAWVIATLRSDFFHRCAEIPGLAELKDGLGSFELLPPTAAEIGEIIRRPALAAGLRFEEDPREGRLDDVLQQAAARDPASLPLLEFTLDVLYEAGKDERVLRFADYHALGGLEGAIARRADEVVANLPERMQSALPSVLRALITVRPGESGITASAAAASEFAADAERGALIDALIGARLVVSSTGGGGPVLRLAHEALLSHWPRARNIVAADRAFLESRSQIQTDQQRWQSENRNPELLLPPGRRLGEAEELLAERREELDQALIAYIEASLETSQRAARRTLRQTRRFAVAMAMLAVLAGIGGYFGYHGQRSAEHRAEQFRVAAVVSNALSAASDPGTQALLLAALQGSQEPPNGAEAARRILNRPIPRSVLRGHEGVVANVVFSPDGSRLASAGDDGTVRIWMADGHREPRLLQDHEGTVRKVVFSPDGALLASAGDDGAVRLWAGDGSGRPRLLLGHEKPIRSIAFSPDGALLASAGSDATVRIWDLGGDGEPQVLRGHQRGVTSIVFSPDNTHLASASHDGTVRVWTLSDNNKPRVLRGHGRSVRTVIFSPDGRRLASAGRDGTVRLWPMDSNSKPRVLQSRNRPDPVRSMAFSPDGARLASAGDEGTVSLWTVDESAEPSEPNMLQSHTRWVSSLAFSPDGAHLASASGDGTIRIWAADGSREPQVLQGHQRRVMNIAFSPEGKRLASAGADGVIFVWDVDSSSEPLVLKNSKSGIIGLNYSADGTRLSAYGADMAVHTWPFDGGDVETRILNIYSGPARVWVFSPDGTRLAYTGKDNSVRVRTLDGSGELLVLQGHEGRIEKIVFSPDGTRLASAGAEDSTVRVWATDSAGKPRVLQGHEGRIKSLAFSPDGTRLASAGDDGTVQVWPLDDSGSTRVLRSYESGVRSVAFSPDGTRLASAGDDGTVRVWPLDGNSGAQVLQGHGRSVGKVVFSPDGTRLASAGEDNTVRVWVLDGDSKPRVLQSKAHVLTRYSGVVWNLIFSPDGDFLASAGDDNAVRVWATGGGGEPLLLSGHVGGVWKTLFSPDGTRLVSADGAGTVRVWTLRWEDLLTRLAASTTACLSPQQRVKYLFEPAEAARAAYEICERRYGRFPLPDGLLEQPGHSYGAARNFLTMDSSGFATLKRPYPAADAQDIAAISQALGDLALPLALLDDFLTRYKRIAFAEPAALLNELYLTPPHDVFAAGAEKNDIVFRLHNLGRIFQDFAQLEKAVLITHIPHP